MSSGLILGLYEYIAQGNIQGLQLLFDDGIIDCNSRFDDGDNLLIMATAKKSYPCVEYLLKLGCDPNITNKKGENSLHIACLTGDINLFRLIRKYINDITMCTSKGYHSFHYAIQSGSIDILNELSKDDNYINIRDGFGRTTLHFAVISEQPIVLEWLILNGAKLGGDRQGKLPLHYSIEKQLWTMTDDIVNFYGVHHLLDTDFDGKTPLSLIKSINVDGFYTPSEHDKYIKKLWWAPYIILVTSTYVFIAMLYFVFITYYVYDLYPATSDYFFSHMTYLLLFGNALFQHYLSCTKDPGFLVDADFQFRQPLYYYGNIRKLYLNYINNNKNYYLKDYCRICKIFKPPRSRHCKQCGRCSSRMDHHCGWIMNCVSENNHKNFILYLFFLCLSKFVYLALLLLMYKEFASSTDDITNKNISSFIKLHPGYPMALFTSLLFIASSFIVFVSNLSLVLSNQLAGETNSDFFLGDCDWKANITNFIMERGPGFKNKTNKNLDNSIIINC